MESRDDHPDRRNASTVSNGGDSLAGIGHLPTTDHADLGRGNHAIHEHPFVYTDDNVPQWSVVTYPAEITPLRSGITCLSNQNPVEEMSDHSWRAKFTSTPVPSSVHSRKLDDDDL